jgi:hypothetical protein
VRDIDVSIVFEPKEGHNNVEILKNFDGTTPISINEREEKSEREKD